MEMELSKDQGLAYPLGFQVAVAEAGIKRLGLDTLLLVADEPVLTYGMFTTNAVKAAPVLWDQKQLQGGGRKIQALLVNSGNANAATGEQGLRDVEELMTLLADELGIEPEQALMCSTGIIGERIPMDKMKRIIPILVDRLSPEDDGAAEAIMTTDTFPKAYSLTIQIGGQDVSLSGITKGAGMIHPNMATMLSFITTDVDIEEDILKVVFQNAVRKSFHSITVDGDQSTNDTVLLMASAQAANPVLDSVESEDTQLFEQALTTLMCALAKDIVRDGEGATKFIQITVHGAANDEQAYSVAMAIARSSLVKTAMFGQDPNWGRILSAAGSCGVSFDPAQVVLKVQDIVLFADNALVLQDKGILAEPMQQEQIMIDLSLGQGAGSSTVWTSDLSYDYVKINAEYHT